MGESSTSPGLCSDATSLLSSPLDYLIIGGGTAGLVLAARLTEDPNVQVGVLEAGKLRLGDPNIESMGGIGTMLNNADYDWAFKSVPQVPTQSKTYDGSQC
jgi:choline dehydrogenase-like flavoprotein